jgi:MscS family membrane protein
VRRLALILLALGFVGPIAVPGVAQDLPLPGIELPQDEESAPAAPDRSHLLQSPQATMSTFLGAMQDLWSDPEAWERAVLTLDLGREDPSNGRERARQLYGVLNRIALVRLAELPDADASAKQTHFRYFPDRGRDAALLRRVGPAVGEVAMQRGADGGWRFSASTVADLEALFAQLEAEPLVAGKEVLTVSDWFEGKLPTALVQNTFLTVKYWAWIAIFLVIVAGLLVDLLARGLVRIASARLVKRLETEEDPKQLRQTLRPIGLTAATLVWLLPIGVLDLEPIIETVLGGALRVFLVFMGTLSAWRIIDLLASLLMKKAERTDTRVDDILVPLISRATKLFILTMGIVYGADALNLPITPLLASLTVAGVGFSFAAKDTVENFFGSVAVVLDRPFDIGDWVVIEGTEGIVEQVGFRSTRIRTFYNSQITIPNSNLVRASVDNYGRRQYRRWKTTLGLQYDTSPDKLLAFTEGVRELIRTHPYTRKDYYQVWCNEFSASSLDILLYMFFEVPDWNTELRERERFFIDILRLAERIGVSFAFPTQTLHLHSGDDAEAPAPGTPPGASTEQDAARSGIEAAHDLVRRQPWRTTKPGPVVFATGPTDGLELDAAGNPIEKTPEVDTEEPKP